MVVAWHYVLESIASNGVDFVRVWGKSKILLAKWKHVGANIYCGNFV